MSVHTEFRHVRARTHSSCLALASPLTFYLEHFSMFPKNLTGCNVEWRPVLF